MKKSVFISLTIGIFLLACSKADDGLWKEKLKNPDLLHRSVKHVTDVIVHDIFSPPVAARIYTYMSIAGYEAAIHQDEKYVTLAGQLKGLEPVPKPEEGVEYCYQLASVQAMLKVGRTLVFSEDKMDGFYEKIMQEFKDTDIPDEVYERSIAYGIQVADHIIAWSGKDNYKQSRSFPQYSILDD